MSDMKPRVLITGSREWAGDELIRAALRIAQKRLGDFTLVSGACPRGADAIGEKIVLEFGFDVERHPANWQALGKRAGYVRNAEMVASAPALCLAFIWNDSRGATMTARLAEEAGIETFIWRKKAGGSGE